MSEQQPVFSIEKIYVKDLSIELPNAPQCFLERESAQIAVQMGSSGTAVGEGTFEVILTVTITAKIGEKTQFLVEVAQAGIFLIQNVPQEDIEPIVAVACPNILFPYAREAVSDAVVRAGFPPVLLAPVNFEAIYRQRLESEQRPHEVPVQ
jgi:preprotein translocase subunit SecB